MMTTRSRPPAIAGAAALAAVAVALTLTACSSSNGTPPSSSSVTTSSGTSTTPSPTPSPTPTTTSPEDLAAQHAESAYRDYLRAQTTCLSDPRKTPPTCFDAVAIGTELNTMRQAFSGAQQMDTKTSGDITVISIKTKSVDLTNKVNESPPTVPKVVFAVCMDVSKYNIVDKDGKSIVPPNRRPHVPVIVSVLNYKLPDPAQWRVGLVTEVKGESC